MTDFHVGARPSFLRRPSGINSALATLFSWVTGSRIPDEATIPVSKKELRDIILPVANAFNFKLKTYRNYNDGFIDVSLSDLRTIHGIAEVAQANTGFSREELDTLTRFLSVFNFNRLFSTRHASNDPHADDSHAMNFEKN